MGFHVLHIQYIVAWHELSTSVKISYQEVIFRDTFEDVNWSGHKVDGPQVTREHLRYTCVFPWPATVVTFYLWILKMWLSMGIPAPVHISSCICLHFMLFMKQKCSGKTYLTSSSLFSNMNHTGVTGSNLCTVCHSQNIRMVCMLCVKKSISDETMATLELDYECDVWQLQGC